MSNGIGETTSGIGENPSVTAITHSDGGEEGENPSVTAITHSDGGEEEEENPSVTAITHSGGGEEEKTTSGTGETPSDKDTEEKTISGTGETSSDKDTEEKTTSNTEGTSSDRDIEEKTTSNTEGTSSDRDTEEKTISGTGETSSDRDTEEKTTSNTEGTSSDRDTEEKTTSNTEGTSSDRDTEEKTTSNTEGTSSDKDKEGELPSDKVHRGGNGSNSSPWDIEQIIQRLEKCEKSLSQAKAPAGKTVESLRRRIHKLEDKAAQVDHLNTRIHELEDKAAQVDHLNTRINELEDKAEQVDYLNTRINELEDKAEQVDYLNTRINELEDKAEQVDHLNTRINELEDKAEQVDYLNTQLQQVSDQLAAQGKLCEEKINHMEADVNKMKTSEDKIEQVKKSHENQLRQMFADNEQRKKDVDGQYMTEIEGRLFSMNSHQHEVMDNMEMKLQRLNDAVKECMRQNDAMEHRLTEIENSGQAEWSNILPEDPQIVSSRIKSTDTAMADQDDKDGQRADSQAENLDIKVQDDVEEKMLGESYNSQAQELIQMMEVFFQQILQKQDEMLQSKLKGLFEKLQNDLSDQKETLQQIMKKQDENPQHWMDEEDEEVNLNSIEKGDRKNKDNEDIKDTQREIGAERNDCDPEDSMDARLNNIEGRLFSMNSHQQEVMDIMEMKLQRLNDAVKECIGQNDALRQVLDQLSVQEKVNEVHENRLRTLEEIIQQKQLDHRAGSNFEEIVQQVKDLDNLFKTDLQQMLDQLSVQEKVNEVHENRLRTLEERIQQKQLDHRAGSNFEEIVQQVKDLDNLFKTDLQHVSDQLFAQGKLCEENNRKINHMEAYVNKMKTSEDRIKQVQKSHEDHLRQIFTDNEQRKKDVDDQYMTELRQVSDQLVAQGKLCEENKNINLVEENANKMKTSEARIFADNEQRKKDVDGQYMTELQQVLDQLSVQEKVNEVHENRLKSLEARIEQKQLDHRAGLNFEEIVQQMKDLDNLFKTDLEKRFHAIENIFGRNKAEIMREVEVRLQELKNANETFSPMHQRLQHVSDQLVEKGMYEENKKKINHMEADVNKMKTSEDRIEQVQKSHEDQLRQIFADNEQRKKDVDDQYMIEVDERLSCIEDSISENKTEVMNVIETRIQELKNSATASVQEKNLREVTMSVLRLQNEIDKCKQKLVDFDNQIKKRTTELSNNMARNVKQIEEAENRVLNKMEENMTATEQRVRESKEETVYIMDEKLQKLMNMVNNVNKQELNEMSKLFIKRLDKTDEEHDFKLKQGLQKLEQISKQVTENEKQFVREVQEKVQVSEKTLMQEVEGKLTLIRQMVTNNKTETLNAMEAKLQEMKAMVNNCVMENTKNKENQTELYAVLTRSLDRVEREQETKLAEFDEKSLKRMLEHETFVKNEMIDRFTAVERSIGEFKAEVKETLEQQLARMRGEERQELETRMREAESLRKKEDNEANIKVNKKIYKLRTELMKLVRSTNKQSLDLINCCNTNLTELETKLNTADILHNQPRVGFNARNMGYLPNSEVMRDFEHILCNEGNHFDVASGVFTAPREGMYVIIVSHNQCDEGEIYMTVVQAKAGIKRVLASTMTKVKNSTGCDSAIVRMEVGDKIYIQLHQCPDTSRIWSSSSFSCFLLG